jgi:hypothetical protein
MSIATGEAQVTRYTSCACPRSLKTKSGGINTPFLINRQVRGSSHGRPKKNFKSSETNAHGHRFTYCFFVTDSLQDCLVRRPWPGGKSVFSMVYCRFSSCLVSLAMAPVSSHPPPPCHVRFVPHGLFFCPLYQQKWRPFLPVYTTPIISDGVASVVPSTCATKVQDTLESDPLTINDVVVME